ncbi:Bypass of stop codon protein 6 [Candida viswanathii]|uniref:Bypass of stop codon protein 6 n=1 Tax=Candida viswanathii TaxID=5486 RepID=A0A367YAK4_9ASCO|nr:Bypass of stop codon protein 6 [Candida viswanathii]
MSDEPQTESSSSSLSTSPLPEYQNVRHEVEFEGEILTIDSTNWRLSRLLKFQILTSFAVFILFGLAEQTVGTILPKLQEHYSINDIQISFIYFCSVAGYLLTAMVNSITHDYLGIRGVAVLGSTSMALAYLIISHKPPFYIFLICYFMSGVGFGTLDASLNTWMGNLTDSNQLLGILHGCYGVGSLISPALITYLLSRSKNPWIWNNYYVILSVVAGLCLTAVILTFTYETPKKYKYVAQVRHEQAKASSRNSMELDTYKNNTLNEEFEIEDPESNSFFLNDEDSQHSATFTQTLKSPLIWSFAVSLFIYVGGEAAFAAWMVTFLTRMNILDYVSASHMATVFWIGVTIGRMFLGFVTAHFFSSELWANFVYILVTFIGCLIFYFLAFTHWIVSLFIVVLITGVAVGPIFPTTIVALVNVLPAKYQVSGIGFICAFGGGGGAGMPFLIGLLAESSEAGLRSYPLVISVMFGILLLLWILIMRKHSPTYKRNSL